MRSTGAGWIVLSIALVAAFGLAVVVVNAINESKRPEKVEQWYREGVAAYQEKRYSDALHSFERAVAREPSHVRANLWAAKARIKLGRLDEAIEGLDRALAVSHGRVRMFLLDEKGDALAKRDGPTLEAIECYRATIAMDPRGYWSPWLKLAKLLSARGERAAAIEVYDDLLRRSPTLTEAREERETLLRSPTDAPRHPPRAEPSQAE